MYTFINWSNCFLHSLLYYDRSTRIRYPPVYCTYISLLFVVVYVSSLYLKLLTDWLTLFSFFLFFFLVDRWVPCWWNEWRQRLVRSRLLERTDQPYRLFQHYRHCGGLRCYGQSASGDPLDQGWRYTRNWRSRTQTGKIKIKNRLRLVNNNNNNEKLKDVIFNGIVQVWVTTFFCCCSLSISLFLLLLKKCMRERRALKPSGCWLMVTTVL